MSMTNEEVYAIRQAYRFLCRVGKPGSGVPRAIREEARRLWKHYPTLWAIINAGDSFIAECRNQADGQMQDLTRTTAAPAAETRVK